ncbi:MAG TPA: protein-L-isoaspartate(D-aspartate) O-methyltransferase [Aggregatilineales bacterium]|nr:protein-L-isoaspartate(D-aspartate) O-methyltransferase [Anaerolineales bacterium]HRE46212.1 protein-L-isoaspartate(D-aspartate) O-methyltransferase [Aggregatilineales bacterium]
MPDEPVDSSDPTSAIDPDYDALREIMIATQISERGITDKRVLEAFRQTPRHDFVPLAVRRNAYADYPLPIGENQTISQPYMVAVMLALLALRGGERVLEIGAGSGYQTALLCHLCGYVYAIERFETLATNAAETLHRLGYTNFTMFHGDGSAGLEAYAPYDVIIAAAVAPRVPQPLIDQLADGGRLIMPIAAVHALPFGRRRKNPGNDQILVGVVRRGADYLHQTFGGVRFVPLVGKHGFRE